MIVFATTLGLHHVPADGGEPELIAVPDTALGELLYAWPQMLPGSGAVLFTIVPTEAETDAEAQIALLDLATSEHTILLRGGSSARYVPTGHLVFSSGARLHAVRFDLDELETSGDPVPLSVEGIATPRRTGGDFDVSADGTLVYVPAYEGASRPRPC